MADAQEPQDEDLVLSYFPDPPYFYRKFTTENLNRLKEIEKEAGVDQPKSSTASTNLSLEQILALPTELRYLIPPPPPADDESFSVFGASTKASGDDAFAQRMEATRAGMLAEGVLEDWNYAQLYPADSASTLDRQNYLFRLLRSLLLSYLALLGLVAVDPVHPAKNERVAEMLNTVMNMHALINEYRPHQARETLIRKMEGQVERKKKEIEGVRKMGERVRGVLEGFASEAEVVRKSAQGEAGRADEVAGELKEHARRKETNKHMWEEMNEVPQTPG